MKKYFTAVAVILVSFIIMLIPQLIHTDFNFANVDWQNVVYTSLIIDVSVYLATLYGNKSKNKDEDNEKL